MCELLTHLRNDNDTLLTDFLHESCENEHEQFILTELQLIDLCHLTFRQR